MDQTTIDNNNAYLGVSLVSDKIMNDFELVMVDLEKTTPEELLFELSHSLLPESSDTAWDDITGPMYD